MDKFISEIVIQLQNVYTEHLKELFTIKELKEEIKRAKNANSVEILIPEIKPARKRIIISASIFGYEKSIEANIPEQIEVELPRFLLGLTNRLHSEEFIFYYRKLFIFKRFVIVRFNVEQIIDFVNKQNFTYNTGFSGNKENQHSDIESFAFRDKQDIFEYYAILKNNLSEKELSKLKFDKSKNTIEYIEENKTLILTYSALLEQDIFDYRVLYNQKDNSLKSNVQNYLQENYSEQTIVNNFLKIL